MTVNTTYHKDISRLLWKPSPGDPPTNLIEHLYCLIEYCVGHVGKSKRVRWPGLARDGAYPR